MRRLVAVQSLLLAGVACTGETIEPEQLEITELLPPAVCDEIAGTELHIVGTGFEPLLEDLLEPEPTFVVSDVTISRAGDIFGGADGSTEPVVDFTSSDGGVVYQSGDLVVTVGPDLELTDGVYDVEVLHPASGTALLQQALLVLSPPVATSLNPSVVPGDDTEEVRINGADFLDLAGELPTVQVGPRVLQADRFDNCVQLAGGLTRLCEAIIVEIDGRDLEPGMHYVRVSNPSPAECMAETVLEIEVTDPSGK